MTYEGEPIKNLARDIKQLRNKSIALVKLLWKKHDVEEATWEPEEAMREQYPNLFTATENDKRTLRRLANDYVLDGEILYKRIKDLELLRCVDVVEAKQILEEVYEGVL
ncbi:reverse transcriptase [Gossypium australe]|uniref:Reverse transcriptase n=1 Tax=Gossypium australe TaxID=47621 RepID=A0A5B6WS84_9ROSI|nr:reverse transcriptase [Gossypium australe]